MEKKSAPSPTVTQKGMPGSVGPRTGPISPRPNSNPTPGKRMDSAGYQAGVVGPVKEE